MLSMSILCVVVLHVSRCFQCGLAPGSRVLLSRGPVHHCSGSVCIYGPEKRCEERLYVSRCCLKDTCVWIYLWLWFLWNHILFLLFILQSSFRFRQCGDSLMRRRKGIVSICRLYTQTFCLLLFIDMVSHCSAPTDISKGSIRLMWRKKYFLVVLVINCHAVWLRV